jgi:parvulin-like peptidyl-prolyl isomerase
MTTTVTPPPSRRTRRAEQISTRRRQRARPSRRSAIIFISAVLLVLAAIPAVGYYEVFIAPLRETIVKVNDTTYDVGYYIERLRILTQQNKLISQQTDLSTEPFKLLDTLRDDELIRQAGPRYGLNVTENEIDAYLRAQLLPPKDDKEQTTQDELDRQYRQLYRQRLNDLKVDEKQYRTITRASIMRDKMREKLSDRVPAVADQVHARVIAVTDEKALTDVQNRLKKGEDFGALAKEVSVDEDTKKDGGDLGWLPRRVMDRPFDDMVFKLDVNGVSDPFIIPRQGAAGQDTIWIVQVIDKAEARQVEGNNREKLKDRALEDWLDEERQQNVVERYFNSDRYDLAIAKVREYNPPVDPNQQAQQQGGAPAR